MNRTARLSITLWTLSSKKNIRERTEQTKRKKGEEEQIKWQKERKESNQMKNERKKKK